MGTRVLDNLRRKRWALAGVAMLLLGGGLQVMAQGLRVQVLGCVILLGGLLVIHRASRLGKAEKLSATWAGLAMAGFTTIVVLAVVFLEVAEPYAMLATIGAVLLANGAAAYWLIRNRRKGPSDQA